MKTTIKPLFATASLIALASQPAFAHRAWVLPSSTVLSGEDQWVTFDAAVSNTLFFPDHNSPAIDSYSVTGPDGQTVEKQNGNKGKFRTTFDVALTKPGTYRVASARESIQAEWKEGEETKTFRGNAEDFKAAALEGKPDLKVNASYSRVETFVTCGEPSPLKPIDKGLEIVFTKTQPNDLIAGEKASFVLHLNGKPAPDITVTVIKGDDRYRSEVGEIKTTTNSQGEFDITWPEAGRYWVNATLGGGRRPGGPGGPGAAGAQAQGEKSEKPTAEPAKAEMPEGGQGGPGKGGPGGPGKGGPGQGGGAGGAPRSGYTATFEVFPA